MKIIDQFNNPIFKLFCGENKKYISLNKYCIGRGKLLMKCGDDWIDLGHVFDFEIDGFNIAYQNKHM